MPLNHLVVIGASAGGVEALRAVVSKLPTEFAAPICVVMHTSPESPGLLHEILERSGELKAISPRGVERLRPGWIYVAPPDYHLIVEPGIVRATKGPRENRFRPAIDPLFRSAAQVYGPAAVGVILTGNLDDGSSGLLTIKRLGGIAIVQDPADALCPSMPATALRYVEADHVVALAEIPEVLRRVVAMRKREHLGTPPDVEVEVNIAKQLNAIDAGVEGLGEPSAYACPECHGVLLRMKDTGLIRFRCHTGHAYSVDSLVAAMLETLEATLWTSIRSLEETALLIGQLSVHAREHNSADADTLRERAIATHRQAKQLRELVMSVEPAASTQKE